MRLYKATYDIKWQERVSSSMTIQYILAPNFQAAARLAETVGKITDKSGGSGFPISGDLVHTLSNLEVIATELNDFQDITKLQDIGSHLFSIIDNRLFKIELLAIKVVEE